MNLKPTTYWCSALLLNRAIALFVALSTVTSSATLFGKDNDDKDKTRDGQSSVQSRERDSGQQEDVNAKTDPEKFIRHVAESGMREIRLANLAKQRAQSEEVKQFAEKLVQDHTKAHNELKLIAQHQNIPWDVTAEKTPAAATGTDRGAVTLDTSTATTEPARSSVDSTPGAASGTARGAYAVNDADSSAQEQRDLYDRLVSLTGKSFEDAYLSHEVQCHTKAVAKFEKANRDLPDGELRQFVQSTLPALRQHLAMAKRMAPTDATQLNIREGTNRDYSEAATSNTPEDQDKANK